jgi:2-dehydropantoate 2-reductase
MRVAVIGAGAIGAVVAGAARDSGHDVTVCVRTPISSLMLEHGEEVRTLGVTLVSSPSGLEPADLVFVTTKVVDNPSLGPWLAALCQPPTVVAAVQNGLDHQAHLAPYLPAGRIEPVFAYLAAERLGPGRVRWLAGDRLVVSTAAAPVIEQAVGAGGLTVRPSSDMWTAAWLKLLGNLVANPLTALTMRRIGVMREPAIADLARGLLREAVAVGRASGAALDDSMIEPVVVATGQYGDATGSSMLYDRLAGRPMEHQFLTGEVVRRGHALGVPVPLNEAMLALLDALDQSGSGFPIPR